MEKRVASVAVGLTVAVLAGLWPAPATPAAPLKGAPPLEFANAATQMGLDFGRTMSWGAALGDYDADGDADIFANRHWKVPVLYRHMSDLYSQTGHEYPSALKKRRWFDRHTCAWGEADGDGNVDLFCASGAQRGEGAGPNQLWVQTRRGFRNVAADLGLEDKHARTRSVSWIDYDSDGDLDIFTPAKYRKGYPNVMFRNDGGQFTKANVGLGFEMNGLASSWSDWDNDGDPDLIVTRYAPEGAVAYVNNRGRFQQVDLEGVSGGQWSSASWGDYDGDGWTDLQLVGPRSSQILKNVQGSFLSVHSTALDQGASSAWLDADNDGDLDSLVVQGMMDGVNKADRLLVNENGMFGLDGTRAASGPRKGSGESAAVADYDRDGRVDLFVTNGARLDLDDDPVEGPWTLLENQTNGGNFVALELQGPAWNPWGFGARVSVQTTTLSYSREINDGMTLRAQSETGHLVLGLGMDQQASVRVEWPDGTSDCLTIDAGTTMPVRIGHSPC